MFSWITDIFMAIMQPCYELTHNWWATILLFTLIAKLVLMPLSLWCQWNSIVMVRMMPALNRVKAKYFGDQEQIGERQSQLNKEYHYHPLLSLIPLAVQVVILFGLVDVIHAIADSGAAGTEFLGLVPMEDGGASWIMPVLATLSAVVMGVASNHINPLQREQSRAEKNSTNGLSIALSFFLGIYVSAGMAFYWVCSNLLSIAVQALCNLCIRPAKYVDYAELEASKAELAELNALSVRKGPWWRPDPLARRERADYKRFFSVVGKHVVFYSERSGFWKYFRGAVEWLLANSDACVHYVTGDPDDQVFAYAESHPRVLPYYVGDKRLITLMMKMDADVVVMTLDDLDNFYVKRSYVRRNTRYVYAFHHPTSLHLVSHAAAFDHYDALMCVGPHQVAEARAREAQAGLAPRELAACGYDLIDTERADYLARGHATNARPTVLIAPSWQEDNILDLCADEAIRPLLGRGWRVVVRPHPEYTKRYRPRWEALQARFADVPAEDLYFEQDFSSSDSILDADVLVTDWSSVFCELALVAFKPCVFVDTPMKETNPEWRDLGIEPTDISLRNRVGVSLAPEELEGRLADVVQEMVDDGASWRDRLEAVRDEMIYHPGHGAERDGRYLFDLMLEAQAVREGDEAAELAAREDRRQLLADDVMLPRLGKGGE
uniref:YidC/Oxa1 family membrane protein insertase n=1 Tax=Parolsenella massiliensis TaxID=1871022 RepID=UPI000A4D3B53|nr:YidC/Oxa1 family membrane protein insertase [Parolsenella massiliensis]